MRTVCLHTLDLDGDGRAEVLANQFVFDDFATAAPWTEVNDWRLPDVACYREDRSYVDVYSLSATATAIAQVRHVQLPFRSAHEYLDRGILSFLGPCGTCFLRIATPPPSPDSCSAAAGAATTSVLPRCRQLSPSASPTAGTTRSRALAAGASTP